MKKIFCSLLLSAFAFANIGPQGFSEFNYNRYFVETGTYVGNGFKKALEANFSHIYSIEINKRLYNRYPSRFKKIDLSKVKLFLGDSSVDLFKMIKDINEPITFWLDAHCCPARKDGGKNCPLVEELAQIGKHHIKNHTILIDDMHCAGTVLFDDLTIEDITREIHKINPDYKIKFVPGGDRGEYPVNVLVAQIH
nr:hypothetical protein [Simkaniaceae bacterium]